MSSTSPWLPPDTSRAPGVVPFAKSEQEYSYGAESPATVAAQQLYVVSLARSSTVTAVVGSLTKGAGDGNHGPFGSQSDSNEHWKAYPCTGTALPLGPVGATPATSNEWEVGFETVTSVGGLGRVATTSIESLDVHRACPSYETMTKHW